MDPSKLENMSMDELSNTRNDLVGKIDDLKRKNNSEATSLEERKEYRSQVSQLIGNLSLVTDLIKERNVLDAAQDQKDREEEFSVMKKPSGGVPGARFQKNSWDDSISKDSHQPTRDEIRARDDLIWRRFDEPNSLSNDEMVKSYRKFAGERLFWRFASAAMDMDRAGFSAEERQIFYDFQNQQRVTPTGNKGTDADGGYLVPVETEAQIIHQMAFMGPLAGPTSGLGSWVRYDNGMDRKVNVNTSRQARKASRVAEAADITKSKAAWAQRTLKFEMIADLFLWTIQLDQDSVSNVRAELTAEMAEGFGRFLNQELLRGLSSNPIGGIFGVPPLNARITTSANAFDSTSNSHSDALITPRELISMKYGIDRAYRGGPDFQYIFSDYVCEALEAMVDSEGRFLYHRSTDGEQLRVHGLMVNPTSGFEAAAAGKLNGGIAAWNKFRVGYVRGLQMTTYREQFMPSLQYGIQCFGRFGSLILDNQTYGTFKFKT